jgi:hypothetical protein
MGQLHYGGTTTIELEDRTLAHVELVMLAKLRRNENFSLVVSQPDGSRTTLWLNSANSLSFEYGVGNHEINRRWLDELIDTANSPGGLRIVPEPAANPAT